MLELVSAKKNALVINIATTSSATTNTDTNTGRTTTTTTIVTALPPRLPLLLLPQLSSPALPPPLPLPATITLTAWRWKQCKCAHWKWFYFSAHLSIANYDNICPFLWQSVQLKTEARPPDAVVLLWQNTPGIACLSFLLRQSRARTVRDYCGDACHVTQACRPWAHRHVHLGKTGVHKSVSVSMAATSPQTLAAFLKLGRSETNFRNFYHDQILTVVLSFDEQQASETMLCRWQRVDYKSLYWFNLALSRCFVLLKCSLAFLK